jgi:AmmeMemoRadiSam system protein B
MPGTPSRSPEGRLRAVLLPHMDYGRGNVTYGFGFKELFEATDARLFVVVATSHYSPARFTLSRQNFATSLGTVKTDQAFVDRVVKRYGDGLFDEPAAHVPEHSIELELPPLQFLYESVSPVRIVPLLVGGFHECVEENRPPSEDDSIRRMADALAAAEAEAGEPVCYLISGDLAHIGPKFDDPDPVHNDQLSHSRAQDEKLLAALTQADADEYFRVIAEEGDARRICGLPPTVLTMLAAKPTHGKVLHYQQYVHPKGHESVSFAAAALYG